MALNTNGCRVLWFWLGSFFQLTKSKNSKVFVSDMLLLDPIRVGGTVTRTTTQADRAGWRATERTDGVEEPQNLRASEDIGADYLEAHLLGWAIAMVLPLCARLRICNSSWCA